jgi:dimethyladenosine transferase
MKYSPKDMNKTLKDKNFNFKKKFGQNFIVDENIVSNIVSKSEVDKETLVIEIGPGAGSLTNKLLEQAGFVLCYEIDNSLKEILKSNLINKKNYKIIFEDFLKADVNKELEKYTYKKIYVVANLPYYITTPIITKIIEDKINVSKIVVMVQKEVGDRFKAVPGTKDYGSLSIYLNYYFSARKLMDVSRNVFMPKPNVDSIIVEFNRKEINTNVNNEELFFKLIRDSFRQKRKTLKNNLKEYNLEKVEEILKKYNLDLSVRAENLSTKVFIEIANNL